MLNTVGILHAVLILLEGGELQAALFGKDLEKSSLFDTSLNSYCIGILKAWSAQYGCTSAFHGCLPIVLTRFKGACIGACVCPGFCLAPHRAHTARCWVLFWTEDTRPDARSKELSLQIALFLIRETLGIFPTCHSCGLHTTVGMGTTGWCRSRFLFKWKLLRVMDDTASFLVRKIGCQIF